MKCDYCKIQYDTLDNVCPACGMPARKRWLKILARILEVFIWFLWICTLIATPPRFIASGHIAMGVTGCLLSLPATYYLLRKIIKRRHKVILSLLRFVLVTGGIFLAGQAAEPNFEFSEDKAVDYAKVVLLQRYEHDDTFVYGDYVVKKGKIDNARWDYIIPLQIQFRYELENGNGDVIKKEATYVFYWDGMTDTYRDEHWELYEDEKVYWESKDTSGFTADEVKKTLSVVAFVFAGIAIPNILLMCLVRKKNQVCFPNPNVKWKLLGFLLLAMLFVVILYSIIAAFQPIHILVESVAEIPVIFAAVWLGADRFSGYTKQKVLYAAAYTGLLLELLFGLALVFLGVPLEPLRFLVHVMLAPYYLVALSIFAYFWMRGRKILGFLLTSVFCAINNSVAYLEDIGILKVESLLYMVLLFVFGVGSYFLFFYIHFWAGKRAESGKQEAF